MSELRCADCAKLLGPLPLYEPLSIDSYEVRMIAFVPGASGPMVECTLQKCSLVYNSPQYVSLSYCWGDENDRKVIIVNDQIVSVTTNLEEALRGLRTVVPDGIFVWVDALCINQEDQQERSFQVRLMTQIYAKAETVYGWLGSADSQDVSAAMRDVATLQRIPGSDQESSTTLESSIVSTGLLAVFQNHLWRRRWIIQELTTASNIHLLCGSTKLTWNELNYAFTKCSSSEDWLPQHWQASDPYIQISVWREQFQRGDAPSLEKAISSSRNYLSKDPRDKIYALLGITIDGPLLMPTPNYSQSASQVCEDLTMALIKKYGNLDIIIADHRSRTTKGVLATWSPDWCSASLSLKPPSERKNMETSSLHANNDLPIHAKANGGCLSVSGHCFGMITSLTSTFNGQLSPALLAPVDCVVSQSSEEYYSTRTNVARALIRAIFLVNTNPLSIWYYNEPIAVVCHIFARSCRSGFSRFLHKDVEKGGASLRLWLQANENVFLGRQKLGKYLSISLVPAKILTGLICFTAVFLVTELVVGLSPHLDAVWLVALSFVAFGLMLFLLLWAMQIIKSPTKREFLEDLRRNMDRSERVFVSRNGAIGVACKDSRPGDSIYILAGCSMPVVLRPQHVDGFIKYTVIGGASICLSWADYRKYGNAAAREYVGGWPWKYFWGKSKYLTAAEIRSRYGALFHTVHLI